MILLLNQRGGDALITNRAVAQITRNWGKEMMTLLLDRRGGDAPITDRADSASVSFARSNMGPPSSFGMGDIPQLWRGRTSSTAQRKRERGEEEGSNEGSRKRR